VQHYLLLFSTFWKRKFDCSVISIILYCCS
jgi:hypothetical protein